MAKHIRHIENIRKNPWKAIFYAVEEKEYSQLGNCLWKKTKLGTLEYLPVTLGELEIPNALITITGKKHC